MNLPAFINCLETEELTSELRVYLKDKGAEFPDENTNDGDIVKDITDILSVTDVVFKAEPSSEEVEWVFNSFVSLITLIPQDRHEGLVNMLCDKLNGSDNTSVAKLKVLRSLFHGLDVHSSYRFVVYYTMVCLASKSDLVAMLKPNLQQIKTWIGQWDVSTQKYQSLLRALHEGLIECKSEMASSVMIELLGTYTEDNASQARDDAQKCIVTCISDPQTFIMDHLLTLKPVKFLEGEPIHDLLTIFVSGLLQEYIQFFEAKPDFISSIGLTNEVCQHKMRILTMMTLAETQQEISFDKLQKEMRLPSEEVESFIIDVVRTQVIRCKLDQINERVIFSSNTQRTFGKAQWTQLREELVDWQRNLSQVLGSLDSLVHHVTPVQPPAPAAAEIEGPK